jgi:hypothetical protein
MPSRVQEQRRNREEHGQHEDLAAGCVPGARCQGTNLKAEERGKKEDASHNDPKDEGAVAIDPERKENGQPEEPAGIARAPEMDQHQFRDQHEVGDGLRPNGKGDGAEEPDQHRSHESHFGIAGVKRAKTVPGYDKSAGEEAEPEHQAREAAAFECAVNRQLREPLLRNQGMMVGGVGEDIREGDGVSGPDDLTHLEVPPQIGIVEARPDCQHSQDGQKDGQHDWEGKDPLQDSDKRGISPVGGNRRCRTQADSTSRSRMFCSKPASGSASLIKRCK